MRPYTRPNGWFRIDFAALTRNGTPCVSGLEGPKSAHYMSIAHQYYEVEGNLVFKRPNSKPSTVVLDFDVPVVVVSMVLSFS